MCTLCTLNKKFKFDINYIVCADCWLLRERKRGSGMCCVRFAKVFCLIPFEKFLSCAACIRTRKRASMCVCVCVFQGFVIVCLLIFIFHILYFCSWFRVVCMKFIKVNKNQKSTRQYGKCEQQQNLHTGRIFHEKTQNRFLETLCCCWHLFKI